MTARLAGVTRAWLAVALAALAIFGAGALNGRPTVFPDTATYYAQGEYLAIRLGIAPAEIASWRQTDPNSLLPGSAAMATGKPSTIAAARSAWYGLFLFVTHRAGTLWLLAGLQALLAGWILWVGVRALAGERAGRAFPAVVAAVAAGSSLPFFTAFAMPDVFAGFGVLAALLLLLCPEGVRGWERTALWVLLAVSLSFHASNLLVLGAVVALGAALLLRQALARGVVLRRTAVIASAFVAAVAANTGYGLAYRLHTGVAQDSPPFLMARLVADGPGRSYLRKACPGGASPTLCGFLGKPLNDESHILWSNDPDLGVYRLSTAEVRTRLKREEQAFVLAVLAHDPFGVVRTAASNAFAQLLMFYVDDPLRHPAGLLAGEWRRAAPAMLVPGIEQCAEGADRCRSRASMTGLLALHGAVLLVAMLLVAWRLGAADLRALWAPPAGDSEDLRRLRLAGALLLAAILVNAIVCGALSGPFARYEARIIWLLPMFAVLAAFARPLPLRLKQPLAAGVPA